MRKLRLGYVLALLVLAAVVACETDTPAIIEPPIAGVRRDVAVVGAPDPTTGQAIIAYVTLRGGAEDEAALDRLDRLVDRARAQGAVVRLLRVTVAARWANDESNGNGSGRRSSCSPYASTRRPRSSKNACSSSAQAGLSRSRLQPLPMSIPSSFPVDFHSWRRWFIRKARESGINVPFVGGDGWDSEELPKIAGDAIKAGVAR